MCFGIECIACMMMTRIYDQKKTKSEKKTAAKIGETTDCKPMREGIFSEEVHREFFLWLRFGEKIW